MDHRSLECGQDPHGIGRLRSSFPMAPVGGEEIGTGDMQPVPGVAYPHAGFIDMENLCIFQEFPGVLFCFCQVPGALLHGCNHGCRTQRVSKEVKDHLRGSLIWKQLIDTEVGQERLQVYSVLHGLRYLRGKFRLVETLAAGTPFALHAMFSHVKPEGRKIENLATIHSGRFDVL
jgi:hypothetical protein